ncbi:selenocysteine-specific translation elongation factor [Tautonia plasticadhaerens]|uniref:selenocysteine-specific translation elongation factor n=1 Tax=Tautonia plasticadhaerens TaxID=2527974 RepID=UPI0018D1FFD8|nr:selenocysteine-specific translation elongation factor [Tautonia plasticadhaerens]
MRDLILGTAGHIDHGKTALVRALTGVDTDRLPAEKQRGITIDLGFAALDLGGARLGLVDVPGHERFIRNMLAGATGFDLALLVVAADDSVMPQTREHLEILRLLGLRSGLVALTKCDLAAPDWLDLVSEDVRALVAGTFLEGAPILRTSSATGEGIDALRAALADAVLALPDRAEEDRPFRMAIDRCFTVAGHGTVVTGTVVSGSVAVGDEVDWLPEGRPVRVRGLHRHDRAADRIARGSRAAINLAGVHHTEIRRGQELASPGFLRPSTVLSASVRASTDAPRPIRHRGRYRVHLGTAEVAASVVVFDGPELAPGSEGLVQLFLSERVVAEHGQPFVIREESPPWTLGGGRILQPVAARIRRRDLDGRGRLVRLSSDAPIERAGAALSSYRLEPWTDHDLARDAGLSPGEVGRIVSEAREAGELVDLPTGPRRSVRLTRAYLAELEDRVVRAVERLHRRNPRLSGVRRSSVLGELSDLRSESLVAALIDRLDAARRLSATDRTVSIAGYQPQLTQAERRLKNELLEAHRGAGFAPPLASELAENAGQRAAIVPELLDLLAEEGHLAPVEPRALYLDPEADAELRRRVVGRLSSEGSTMTMADLRDLLRTSRKYAVPIGEYLDRVGLTLRDGDLRRLGPAASGADDARP